jgi:hypothetical protein
MNDTPSIKVRRPMKSTVRITLGTAIVLALLVFLTSCVTLNRLNEVRLEGRTAAAIVLSPPRAEVSSGFSFWVDPDDPVGSAIRIGTGIIKDAEARRAQERMDRALELVDLAEIIRERTLQGGAEALGCRPIGDADRAEILFDIEIREYGIDIPAGQLGLNFTINIQVELRDREEDLLLWRRRIREVEPITPSVFGLDETVGNVVTAVILSRLSEQEMAQGLERLAEDAGGRIVSRLHRDFVDARYR